MPDDRTLLIVEDDPAFAPVLRRSFERRGYTVHSCDGVDSLNALIDTIAPRYAVVDLKGRRWFRARMREAAACPRSRTRIVVLTGFASIATAVEAIKLGACHYLAKPANTDDIEAGFGKIEGDAEVPLTQRHTSLKNLEWERIHETLVESDFNISEPPAASACTGERWRGSWRSAG